MAGVRRATQVDVKEIIEFLEKYHIEESNLADIPFDKGTMIRSIEYYLTHPKHVIFVYTVDDKITGILMGNIEPFIFNDKRQWATDLVFAATTGGAWLLKRFINWAKLYKIDRIVMGVSSGSERAGELYTALGMTHIGGMYCMTVCEESAS